MQKFFPPFDEFDLRLFNPSSSEFISEKTENFIWELSYNDAIRFLNYCCSYDSFQECLKYLLFEESEKNLFEAQLKISKLWEEKSLPYDDNADSEDDDNYENFESAAEEYRAEVEKELLSNQIKNSSGLKMVQWSYSTVILSALSFAFEKTFGSSVKKNSKSDKEEFGLLYLTVEALFFDPLQDLVYYFLTNTSYIKRNFSKIKNYIEILLIAKSSSAFFNIEDDKRSFMLLLSCFADIEVVKTTFPNLSRSEPIKLESLIQFLRDSSSKNMFTKLEKKFQKEVLNLEEIIVEKEKKHFLKLSLQLENFLEHKFNQNTTIYDNTVEDFISNEITILAQKERFNYITNWAFYLKYVAIENFKELAFLETEIFEESSFYKDLLKGITRSSLDQLEKYISYYFDKTNDKNGIRIILLREEMSKFLVDSFISEYKPCENIVEWINKQKFRLLFFGVLSKLYVLYYSNFIAFKRDINFHLRAGPQISICASPPISQEKPSKPYSTFNTVIDSNSVEGTVNDKLSNTRPNRPIQLRGGASPTKGSPTQSKNTDQNQISRGKGKVTGRPPVLRAVKGASGNINELSKMGERSAAASLDQNDLLPNLAARQALTGDKNIEYYANPDKVIKTLDNWSSFEEFQSLRGSVSTPLGGGVIQGNVHQGGLTHAVIYFPETAKYQLAEILDFDAQYKNQNIETSLKDTYGNIRIVAFTITEQVFQFLKLTEGKIAYGTAGSFQDSKRATSKVKFDLTTQFDHPIEMQFIFQHGIQISREEAQAVATPADFNQQRSKQVNFSNNTSEWYGQYAVTSVEGSIEQTLNCRLEDNLNWALNFFQTPYGIKVLEKLEAQGLPPEHFLSSWTRCFQDSTAQIMATFNTAHDPIDANLTAGLLENYSLLNGTSTSHKNIGTTISINNPDSLKTYVDVRNATLYWLQQVSMFRNNFSTTHPCYYFLHAKQTEVLASFAKVSTLLRSDGVCLDAGTFDVLKEHLTNSVEEMVSAINSKLLEAPDVLRDIAKKEGQIHLARGARGNIHQQKSFTPLQEKSRIKEIAKIEQLAQTRATRFDFTESITMEPLPETLTPQGSPRRSQAIQSSAQSTSRRISSIPANAVSSVSEDQQCSLPSTNRLIRWVTSIRTTINSLFSCISQRN